MVGWQKDYLEAFVPLTPFSGPDSQQLFSPEALLWKSHCVLTGRAPAIVEGCHMWQGLELRLGDACSLRIS